MDTQEFLETYLNDVEYSLEKKGNRLYAKFKDEIILKSLDEYEAELMIPSESNGDESYAVSFSFEQEIEYTEPYCDCPAFENYDDCKHCVAAALYLVNIIRNGKDKNLESNKASAIENEADTDSATDPEKIIVTFQNISHQQVQHFTKRFYRWEYYRTRGKNRITKYSGSEHSFKYKESAKKTYLQQINFLQPDKLEVSCTCGDAEQDNFCRHLMAALNLLDIKFGDHYFSQFKDKAEEKKALLAPYGLLPGDEEAKDFVFEKDYYGNLIIKSAPGYLVKMGDEDSLSSLAKLFVPATGQANVRPQLPAGKFINFELGYLFNFALKQHIHFLLQPLAITKKNDKTTYDKITLSKKENFALLKSLPDEQYILFEQLTDEAMHTHLVRSGFIHLANYSSWQQQMTKEAVEKLLEYYHGILQKLWLFLAGQENVFSLSPVKTFSNRI